MLIVRCPGSLFGRRAQICVLFVWRLRKMTSAIFCMQPDEHVARTLHFHQRRKRLSPLPSPWYQNHRFWYQIRLQHNNLSRKIFSWGLSSLHFDPFCQNDSGADSKQTKNWAKEEVISEPNWTWKILMILFRKRSVDWYHGVFGTRDLMGKE